MRTTTINGVPYNDDHLWAIDPLMSAEHQAEVNAHNQQVLELTNLEAEVYGHECSVEVESSNIVAVGYSPTLTMWIKFSSGATYRYNHVLFREFWALVNAESVGKYFTTHIRNCKDITCVKES